MRERGATGKKTTKLPDERMREFPPGETYRDMSICTSVKKIFLRVTLPRASFLPAGGWDNVALCGGEKKKGIASNVSQSVHLRGKLWSFSV